MKSLHFSRYALTSCVAGAMLAGCSGSQAPISAPGAMPYSPTAQPVPARKSPTTRKHGEALIYVTGPTQTYIVSYTDGSIVGTINMTNSETENLCSDKKGNVFIPNGQDIWEYKHGATTPIADLKDAGYFASGCSADPTTGNLAVSNSATSDFSGPGNIAIYAGAAGKPAFYADPNINGFYSCAYDNSGNLYANGGSKGMPFIFAELPKGSAAFETFNLNKPSSPGGEVQWDGHYVALGALNARLIYRVKVSGSTATVVATTRLDTLNAAEPTFWLHGSFVLTASGAQRRKIGFWKYPRGGKPVKQYGPIIQKERLGGVTVSVVPR